MVLMNCQCLVQDTSEVPIPSRTPDKGQDVFKQLGDTVSPQQMPAHALFKAAALHSFNKLEKGRHLIMWLIIHDACSCLQGAHCTVSA